MKEEIAKFITPARNGWSLINTPDPPACKTTHNLQVDENVINDIMECGGTVAIVKEPFIESIINLFVRIISGIVPGAELKCAYVLDFGDIGKVNLYMAQDVWSSTALVTTDQPDKINLLLDASKEYIRYRCFVDSSQPQ